MLSEGFLSRGVTKDCLKLDGKQPVDSERLTIVVIVGARTGRHFFQNTYMNGVEFTLLVWEVTDESTDFTNCGWFETFENRRWNWRT